MFANGKDHFRGFVNSNACSDVILSWSTWVLNKGNYSATVGLLESEEVIGHLVGTIGSIMS